MVAGSVVAVVLLLLEDDDDTDDIFLYIISMFKTKGGRVI